MKGNEHKYGNTYISAENMDVFAKRLIEINPIKGILLTPYLIENNNKGIFELHYYEFEIDFKGDKTFYVEHNLLNTLPSEIIQYIKPRVIISEKDPSLYFNIIRDYLNNMKKMQFRDIIEHYPKLKNSKIFYQIFL